MQKTQSSTSKFHEVDYAEPHIGRRKDILKAHPEVRKLFGPTPSSFVYLLAVVALQFAMAVILKSSSWWLIVLSAYVIGAVANHALFVLIHECTHNLIFKGIIASKITAIFANLPIVAPVAMGFRKYHLIHHKHQGEIKYDADLPGLAEARIVGESPIRKALWLLGFGFIEGAVRPTYLKAIKLMDNWVWINSIVCLSFAAAFTAVFGLKALAYLFISTVFSVGLHPLGARWIQEHFVFRDNQETYSYYGPANLVAFNVGHHNEHHDFMNVPWSRLPAVRRLAPEFYDNLHFHTSYTKLLFVFLKTPSVNLYSRVIRPGLELGKVENVNGATLRNNESLQSNDFLVADG